MRIYDDDFPVNPGDIGNGDDGNPSGDTPNPADIGDDSAKLPGGGNSQEPEKLIAYVSWQYHMVN